MIASSRSDTREKEGTKMNKLRMIELIDADSGLLMRIFLGLRIEEGYEKDKKLPKHDHGSRKDFQLK